MKVTSNALRLLILNALTEMLRENGIEDNDENANKVAKELEGTAKLLRDSCE